ncbi:dTMP kinase [Arachnia propionica]|uniref:dTMP kinase n=1 Tax=Arachnia propionica TaxID=1750 RepID=UPI0030D24C10
MSTSTTTPGLFVVFEGGDGVGKSTQVVELVSRLRNRRIEPVVTRQPGGTPIGEKLRELLLDPGHPELTARTEALVYAADKAQHVEEVILPALAYGKVVVCDRYVDSMIAYQGAGRVLDLAEVEQVARWATGGLRPDLTVLLDIDPAEAVANIRQQDRLEAAGLDFHRRAREHFLRLAGEDPERYLVLGARESRENIAEKVAEKVLALLG